MKVAIVDDEMFAREALKDLLAEFANIDLVGEFSNAVDCLKALKKCQPEVLFLDIEMPMINGLELAAMIDTSDQPEIIFITAYDQFAIQAFEQNAIDYLLKPVQHERLQQTIERLQKRAEKQQPSTAQMLTSSRLTLIPCHQYQTTKLIRLEAFEYAFSDVSGVHLWNGEDLMHTQLTLKLLEQRTSLIRCHRQYLVCPDAIREITQQPDGNALVLTQSGQQIPVSRRYFKTLRELFSVG